VRKKRAFCAFFGLCAFLFLPVKIKDFKSLQKAFTREEGYSSKGLLKAFKIFDFNR